jgi:hypothetical protein
MEVLFVFTIAIGIFAVIAGFIFSTILKRRKESWSGVVTDKKVVEEVRRNDGYKSKVNVHYLMVKLSGGTDKKISVGKKLWDNFSTGDKIEKKAGSFDPIKG